MPILNIQGKEIRVTVEQADKILSFGNSNLNFILKRNDDNNFSLVDVKEEK